MELKLVDQNLTNYNIERTNSTPKLENITLAHNRHVDQWGIIQMHQKLEDRGKIKRKQKEFGWN